MENTICIVICNCKKVYVKKQQQKIVKKKTHSKCQICRKPAAGKELHTLHTHREKDTYKI